MQRNDEVYKVVSLFSGGMGLDLGLAANGRHEIIACVESERSFCETIRINQIEGRLPHGLIIFEDDIQNLSGDDILKACGLAKGEVDLLVGGPPCQSFSTVGRRRTTDDTRGTLLWHFLRFVEDLQPKFFLMENVRGLLSAALKHRPIAERPNKGGPPLKEEEQPGSVVSLFAHDLQEISGGPYHMDCFEVNAVNYGAPQLRERAFFIGNRFNAEVDFPRPTHGNPNINETKSDFFTSNGIQNPWATLRSAIYDLEDPGDVIMDFSPRKKHFLSMVPEGSNWRSLPVEKQKESMGKAWHAKGGRSGWWRRLSYDLPCPTLVTMPNHASTSLCHPTQLRALSLREYARIQEFPDNWKFYGKTHQQYAQAGNAVPLRLGRIAGDVIASELDHLRKSQWRPKKRSAEAYRIVYVQSHIRTRKWYKAGQAYVWEDGKAAANQPRYHAPVAREKVKTIGIGSQMAHQDLPKRVQPTTLSKNQIFGQLQQIDSDRAATKRVLELETEFRRRIDAHLSSLPQETAHFDKFKTSPFVVMMYSKQKGYTHVSEIENDLVPAKVFSSMETSAGRMVEAVALPVYGWEAVESQMHSNQSVIDGHRVTADTYYAATLKSGPRCLNDEMARDIGVDLLIYGGLYGTKKQSNKKDWHILRNIAERLPEDAKIYESHKNNWRIRYTIDGVQTSATVLIGTEWWQYLGGEWAPIELCLALIRACIPPTQPKCENIKHMIADLDSILDLNWLDQNFNVSIIQESQWPWLLFMLRHFCDHFTVDDDLGLIF